MSTHNIHFHDKKGKIPIISLNICFRAIGRIFLGTQKRARFSNGKRVIGVRVIEVLL